jgi:hypothetical protein
VPFQRSAAITPADPIAMHIVGEKHDTATRVSPRPDGGVAGARIDQTDPFHRSTSGPPVPP